AIQQANQYMSERITGVEGTKLDADFTVMENEQISSTNSGGHKPQDKGVSSSLTPRKLSGQAKASTYPPAKGTLGDAMCTYGRQLQDFDNGRPSQRHSSIRLDDSVKQTSWSLSITRRAKDLKEVFHHRKKLHGRKLDFDCKKRKQVQTRNSSRRKRICRVPPPGAAGMHNLLDGSGIEHISQLTQFAEALHDYHKHCTRSLASLSETLYDENERGFRKAQ
ncbi:Uncharacterized protein FKW44_023965, partial [Caligus rogercresseyi]